MSRTPGGIMRLLEAYDVDLAGPAVVVGRSPILGKPVGTLLPRPATRPSRTATRARRTASVRAADAVVAAAGRPRLIRGDDIKPGAVVIDARHNPGNVGDIDFKAVRTRAGLITPVPGGVGTMTMAVLLAQSVDAAAEQLGVPHTA